MWRNLQLEVQKEKYSSWIYSERHEYSVTEKEPVPVVLSDKWVDGREVLKANFD